MQFDPNTIYWQAHRGGGAHEAPDNTLKAMHYGWSLGGIPEADIRITQDDVIVCLHDDTLARTTDAPEDIRDLPIQHVPFSRIQPLDAGRKFRPDCAGQRVPALAEVFDAMRQDPTRMLYCDIKNYDPQTFPRLFDGFKTLVDQHGLADQLIVAGCDYALNRRFKREIPAIHTLQWLGYWGPLNAAEQKLRQFDELARQDFADLDLVQFHLLFNPKAAPHEWPFDIAEQDLRRALGLLGPRLQVFPWSFSEDALRQLVALGIRQFATDEPSRFAAIIRSLA